MRFYVWVEGGDAPEEREGLSEDAVVQAFADDLCLDSGDEVRSANADLVSVFEVKARAVRVKPKLERLG